MLVAELDEVGHARHRAVLVHDLADNAGGNHAGEPREIDRAFRLTGANEHAALARAQREDVSRTREITGARLGIDGDLDGAGAVVGADAGGDAFTGIDGFAESGAELRSVLGGHGADAESVKA